MGPPGLVNLDAGELCASAGGDPWKLDSELQTGDAGAINSLADAFHKSGNHVKEADDDFDKAKQQFQAAYTRNGAEHPINESTEVQRAGAALKEHKEALPRIAASLEEVAASLATAQRDSDSSIGTTNSALQDIDNQMSLAKEINLDTDNLHDDAVGVVKSAVAHIEEIRGAYVGQLHAAESAMMASGYTPDVLDSVDGIPDDAPADAARNYDKSGQRTRDQALVDKAKSEGRTHYIANSAGQPGNMTDDEAAASQRLKDYQAITDPTARYGPGYDPREIATSQRLAGERLDDYNTANSSGPVYRDPVLGGDARTRAQTRLQLQHDLEQGQLPWSHQFMTPDQATATINGMEANDRVRVLANLQGQLCQGGMSPEGAAALAEGLAHGRIPEEYVQAAGGASKVFESGEKGYDRVAGMVEDHGSHWTAEASALNAHDVEWLEKVGRRVGGFGSALELGTAAYEIFGEHKPPLEVAAKTAGGMAGMWAGTEALAPIGGAIGGPPGAFVFALAGGVGGAYLGENGVESVMKWLKE